MLLVVSTLLWPIWRATQRSVEPEAIIRDAHERLNLDRPRCQMLPTHLCTRGVAGIAHH